MSQKSPSKVILLQPIENQRRTGQSKKNPQPTTQHMTIHIDPTNVNHDTAANTFKNAEQVSKPLEKRDSAEEAVQMLVQNEASEAYWKLITERRKQAIEETTAENQQLHDLIDEVSKENEQLRLLSSHCDYLQNVLNSFTNEHDSILDNSSTS